jgi:hypothetical protein
MTTHVLRTAFIAFFLFLLAGCETAVPENGSAEITFLHLKPIRLNVVDLQITTAPGAAIDPRGVSARFPTPPIRAMNRWAQDRLRAAGPRGVARFTIHTARVSETPLNVDTGIKGLFKTELSERYTANVEGSLEILDPNGLRRARVVAKAERSATIREDTTVNERRERLFKLVEDLMADFNNQMETNIDRYMVEYLL